MGISTHSIARTLYLFSVFNTTRQPEGNEELHLLVTDYLSNLGIKYIETEGSYEGIHERGILMDSKDMTENAVQIICKQYNQKCYLTLTSYKHGTYAAFFTDISTNGVIFAGYLRSFPKSDIDRLKLDYTYRRDIDTYFSIWHSATTELDDFEEEKEEYDFRNAFKIPDILPPAIYFPRDSHALI